MRPRMPSSSCACTGTRVRGYDEPAAWVRRVAINRLRNRDRGLLRRAAAMVRLESLFEPAVAPVEPPLDLAAALRRLPERQRVAVALHYVDGLPVDRGRALHGHLGGDRQPPSLPCAGGFAPGPGGIAMRPEDTRT